MCQNFAPVRVRQTSPDAEIYGAVEWRRFANIARPLLVLGRTKLDLNPQYVLFDAPAPSSIFKVAFSKWYGTWPKFLLRRG